jgi:tetratricopeptide (TPR) repeat protein
VSAALAVPGGSAAARLKALNAAGVLAGEAGDRAVSREMFEGSLELADAMGDDEAGARASSNLGTLALYAGDFDEAARRYEGSVGYWREVGNDRGLSLNLQNLALANEGLGRRGHAIELLEDAVGLARHAGDPAHLASTLRSLARLLLKADRDPARAVALLRESLLLSQDLGDRPGIVECLESLAAVAGRNGDALTGALLAGAAETTRSASGATQQPNELEWVRAETAALREALGDQRFAATFERGRGLDGGEAVERALAVVT